MRHFNIKFAISPFLPFGISTSLI